MISSNQLSPVAQAWLQYYNPKLLHAGIGLHSQLEDECFFRVIGSDGHLIRHLCGGESSLEKYDISS